MKFSLAFFLLSLHGSAQIVTCSPGVDPTLCSILGDYGPSYAEETDGHKDPLLIQVLTPEKYKTAVEQSLTACFNALGPKSTRPGCNLFSFPNEGMYFPTPENDTGCPNELLLSSEDFYPISFEKDKQGHSTTKWYWEPTPSSLLISTSVAYVQGVRDGCLQTLFMVERHPVR